MTPDPNMYGTRLRDTDILREPRLLEGKVGSRVGRLISIDLRLSNPIPYLTCIRLFNTYVYYCKMEKEKTDLRKKKKKKGKRSKERDRSSDIGGHFYLIFIIFSPIGTEQELESLFCE